MYSSSDCFYNSIFGGIYHEVILILPDPSSNIPVMINDFFTVNEWVHLGMTATTSTGQFHVYRNGKCVFTDTYQIRLDHATDGFLAFNNRCV